VDLDDLMRATGNGRQYDVLWKQKRRDGCQENMREKGLDLVTLATLGC